MAENADARDLMTQEEDDDENEIHVSLDEDTYGAALFCIVEDITTLFGSPTTSYTTGCSISSYSWGCSVSSGQPARSRPRSLVWYRLIFVHAVLLANYILQFGMLYFIRQYVVEPAVKAQMASAEEAEDNPDGDTSLMAKLLCAHPMFLIVVLILWVLTILIELRKVERFIRQLTPLKTVAVLVNQITPDTNDDGDPTWEIKGVTRCTWAIIVTFIIIPKIVIVVCLFVFGFEWLAATQAPADLILNALALEFVVNIDEQLFEALIPNCVKNKMGSVYLVAYKKTYADKKEEMAGIVKAEWAAYQRSIGYFVAPIIISTAYVVHMQIKLTEKGAC